MTARLTAKAWTSGLIRRVHAAGGFATVLRHGDDTAGSVILVLLKADGGQTVLTRAMRGESYIWVVAADHARNELEHVNDFLDKQRSYDPDLWIIELDIAHPERFIDEPIQMN